MNWSVFCDVLPCHSGVDLMFCKFYHKIFENLLHTNKINLRFEQGDITVEIGFQKTQTKWSAVQTPMFESICS